MIEYSCFVRKGTGATCKFCSKRLEQGDPYVHMMINRFAKPHFHAQCLVDAGNKALAEQANLETIKEKYEEDEKIRHKALKEAQQPILFRKQIIRDSLKDQGVDVRNISVRAVKWPRTILDLRNLNCVLCVENSVQISFCKDGLMIIDGLPPRTARLPVTVPASQEIHLADPESLDKLGKALIDRDYRGHIKSRLREVK